MTTKAKSASKPSAKPSKAKKPSKATESASLPGFTDYDQAQGVKNSSTAELKEARLQMKDFLKETGLKKGKDYSTDKKHGKAWVALNSKVEDLEAQRKAAIDYIKNNKPKKSGGDARSTKYNYPEEIAAIADKDEQQLAMKKYRTSIRGKAKRAEVSVDEYLSDPAKYADKPKATAPSKAKKGATPKKKSKPAED